MLKYSPLHKVGPGLSAEGSDPASPTLQAAFSFNRLIKSNNNWENQLAPSRCILLILRFSPTSVRFKVLPNNHLQIRGIKKTDEGPYTCEGRQMARGEIDLRIIRVIVNGEKISLLPPKMFTPCSSSPCSPAFLFSPLPSSRMWQVSHDARTR